MAEVTLKFAGVNNVSPPDSLGVFEDTRVPLLRWLTAMQNFDAGEDAEATVREGFALALAGSAHSGWSTAGSDRAFFVESAALKQFLGTSATSLLTLSTNDRTVFVEVNNGVVFTNGTDIGFIDASGASLFGAVTTEFKRRMPAGQHLAFHNGRLWVAVGSILYRSDAYNIEQYDERTGVLPMPADIEMLKAVQSESGGGLWLAYTGKTAFLQGGDEAFKDVVPYGAVPHTATHGKAEWFGVQGLSGNIVVWRSSRGVCVGDETGRMINMSEGSVALKPGTEGAAIIRHSGGGTHFLSTVRAPGSEYNIYT